MGSIDVKSWPSTGIANKDNLMDWSDRAKSNSNHPGHRGEAKQDPGLGDDWKVSQKCEEGRGWTKAKADTYTGPGGSKRD
jgi:hypothetical protein